MNTKCKNCCLCPKEIIDNYKQLKKNTEKEFESLIKDWLIKHPYIDYIALADTSTYYTNSMTIFDGNSLTALVHIKEPQ